MTQRIFLYLHRWSGIVAAALIVALGLTGSILVFRDGLDRRLNADILDVTPRAQRLALDELVARVEVRHPEAQVNSVVPFEDPTHAWTFFLGRRGGAGVAGPPGRDRYAPDIIHVDPYTGAITGARTGGAGGFDRRGFVPLMHGIHHDLLLEAPGHWLVAGTGLVWMILSLVGIYLSIKQAGGFTAAFRVRADVNVKRLFLDLHRSFGMATVVLVVVLSVSGIYLGLRQPTTQMIGLFSPVTLQPERALPDNRLAAPSVGFAGAVEAASAGVPGSRIQSVFAVRPKGVYRVRVATTGDLNERGDRFVYVSMQDASIVQVRDVTRGTAGDVFIGWQFPLHTGQAFGAVGQAVVFVLGLLPLLFSITGLYLWLKNRRKARRAFPSAKTRQQPSGSQRSAASSNP